jgi:hypothetical protein
MTREERKEQNQKHFDLPEAGDYWHERFSPYFIVLDVDYVTGLYIVCDVKKDIDNHSWTFDTTCSKQVTRKYFDCVKYASIPEFVADVVTGHEGFIRDWEHYGKPFTPIQPIVPVEPEKFNYCVGHYWSDGDISYWDDGCVVRRGTKEDADKFLEYVNTINDRDYKIFRLTEEV